MEEEAVLKPSSEEITRETLKNYEFLHSSNDNQITNFTLEDLLKDIEEIPEIKNKSYLISSLDKYIKDAKTSGKLSTVETILKELKEMKKYITYSFAEFYFVTLKRYVSDENFNEEKTLDILNKMKEIVKTLESLSNDYERIKTTLSKITEILRWIDSEHINEDMIGLLEALKRTKSLDDVLEIVNKFEEFLNRRYELEEYSRTLTNFYHEESKIMDKKAGYEFITFRYDISTDKIFQGLQEYEKEALKKVIKKNRGVVYRGLHDLPNITQILEELSKTGCLPISPEYNRVSTTVFYSVAELFAGKTSDGIGMIFIIKAPENFEIPVRKHDLYEKFDGKNFYERIVHIPEGEVIIKECIRPEDIKKIEVIYSDYAENDKLDMSIKNKYVIEPKSRYFTREDIKDVIRIAKAIKEINTSFQAYVKNSNI